MSFEDLNPPYATIVADPPWAYDEGWPRFGDRAGIEHIRTPLPYSSLDLDGIGSLPVAAIAAKNAHLYLWTTNRYLYPSYGIAEGWGFRVAQVLTWCKTPAGIGPGGAYASTTEFVLFCRKGTLKAKSRCERNWWNWPRGVHSQKPGGFLDVVESVSPGPYVELFARQPRLGWDAWGYGIEGVA